jgi:AcrR family transcriptional regulator
MIFTMLSWPSRVCAIMSDPSPTEARPYHHGDLRRALVEAARQLVETEGPSAMSLRAVARHAGVSPAAPYHHFKDKAELLAAVAKEGWAMLSGAVLQATQTKPGDTLAPTIAYVSFARSHPALYRIMYDAARDAESLPFGGIAEGDSPYAWVREALERQSKDTPNLQLELEIAASWCASHGLSEMAGFRQFDHLKAELGGEEAFLRALLSHLRLHTHLT